MPKRAERDWKSIVIIEETLALGALLWKVLPKNAAETNIQMNFGKESLKLNVMKDMSAPQALIGKLWSTQFSRAGTLDFLLEKKVYALNDLQMITGLKKLCSNADPPGDTLIQRQDQLRKCLQGNDADVLKQMRDLAKKHRAPFEYIGRQVRIGTPSGRQPHVGDAFVCSNDDDFMGQQIQITSLQGQKHITVKATSFYTCTGVSDDPDIQINARGAYKLLGRPTRKLENAIAVVL